MICLAPIVLIEQALDESVVQTQRLKASIEESVAQGISQLIVEPPANGHGKAAFGTVHNAFRQTESEG